VTHEPQQRMHHRFGYTADAQARVGDILKPCTLEDFSYGGLGLACVHGAAVGQPIVVFAALPIAHQERTRYCRLAGRIAWTTSERVGVAFDEIPFDTYVNLDAAVQALR
jgi:hypothetical protein